MNYLIIDTATTNLYIALVNNEEILCEYYNQGKNDHSKNALYMVSELTKKYHFEIESVICGVGPGSYTGVRIGVTIAKMLATLKNIPLYSISTLYLMSSDYNEERISYIDARRGNCFSCFYGHQYGEEALRNTEAFFKEHQNALIVGEENMRVNPIKVIKKANLVENPHALIPNYLRDTEAERNLGESK